MLGVQIRIKPRVGVGGLGPGGSGSMDQFRTVGPPGGGVLAGIRSISQGGCGYALPDHTAGILGHTLGAAMGRLGVGKIPRGRSTGTLSNE